MIKGVICQLQMRISTHFIRFRKLDQSGRGRNLDFLYLEKRRHCSYMKSIIQYKWFLHRRELRDLCFEPLADRPTKHSQTSGYVSPVAGLSLHPCPVAIHSCEVSVIGHCYVEMVGQLSLWSQQYSHAYLLKST